MEKLVLIGFGGHSKSVIDTIEAAGVYTIAGVLEKQENMKGSYRRYRVLGTDKDLEEIYRDGLRNAFVTIGYMGNSSIRNRIYGELKRIGYELPVIADPSAVIAEDVRLGEGTFIGKGAVINAGASVGKMCIINTRAVLEHECQVCDFSHISVGTILCGQTNVEENCFVGAGATVIQGIRIGKNSIVGAGSIVVRDVGDDMQVYNKIEKVCKRGMTQ